MFKEIHGKITFVSMNLYAHALFIFVNKSMRRGCFCAAD